VEKLIKWFAILQPLITLAYSLLTLELTFLDLNDNLSHTDWMLQHKWRLWKLLQETRDPVCKMAVKWVTKTIRRLTWRKALEW